MTRVHGYDADRLAMSASRARRENPAGPCAERRSRAAIGVAALGALALAGCASTPKISDLRQAAGKVELVRNGTTAWSYSTGVIDAASTLANVGAGGAGEGVAVQTTLSSLAAAGTSEMASKAPGNKSLMKQLVGNSDFAAKINSALLRHLAAAWHVRYDESSVVTAHNRVTVDPNTEQMHGLQSDADLILMTEVANVELTERPTLGAALKDGLTMGFGKKRLTAQVLVVMNAMRRNADGAGYREVWYRVCQMPAAAMTTYASLAELRESPQKFQPILQEAAERTIEVCGKVIDSAT